MRTNAAQRVTADRSEVRVFPASVMDIVIRSADGPFPLGEIRNVCLREAIPFCGFAQMALQVDALCSALGAPQASLQLRSFRQHRAGRVSKALRLVSGGEWPALPAFSALEQGTGFRLRLVYRQHGTWQGYIQYYGEAESAWFASVSELLESLSRHSFSGEKQAT